MSFEQQKREALGIIKDIQRRVSKRNRRIHMGALDDNLHRERALNGICGNCQFAQIKFPYIDGRQRVDLGCQKDHLPLEMYRRTPLGKEPVCPSFRRI